MRLIQRLVLVCVFTVISGAASAQNNRSFVSTTGNDANTCTAGNECRSFTRAIAVTNADGEVLAITSGGYGPFVVNKAVTVMGAPGIAAELTVASGNAIDINAGASDTVVLRGLNINIAGGAIGIWATAFRALFIENCAMTGGQGGIVSVGPAGSFTAITDTTVRNTLYGIQLSNHAALSHCRLEANYNVGLSLFQGSAVDAVVSAVDLVSVGNTGFGVQAGNQLAAHSVTINLDRALISGNGFTGVVAEDFGGPVSVRLTNSTVADNGNHGIAQNGSAFFGSLNNNLVEGNLGGDTAGTITPLTAR